MDPRTTRDMWARNAERTDQVYAWMMWADMTVRDRRSRPRRLATWQKVGLVVGAILWCIVAFWGRP